MHKTPEKKQVERIRSQSEITNNHQTEPRENLQELTLHLKQKTKVKTKSFKKKGSNLLLD